MAIQANKFYCATDTFGFIELVIAGRDILKICHSGQNDEDVHEVYQQPYIRRQMWDAGVLDKVRRVIENYDSSYLKESHTIQEYKEFVLWILAWDVLDAPEDQDVYKPMTDEEVMDFICNQ